MVAAYKAGSAVADPDVAVVLAGNTANDPPGCVSGLVAEREHTMAVE